MAGQLKGLDALAAAVKAMSREGRDLHKQFVAVLVVASIAMSLVVVVLLQSQPGSASAMVFPTRLNTNVESLIDISNDLLGTKEMQSRVLQQSNVDPLPGTDPVGQLVARSVGSTSALTIVATHQSPTDAAEIANAAASILAEAMSLRQPDIGDFASQLAAAPSLRWTVLLQPAVLASVLASSSLIAVGAVIGRVRRLRRSLDHSSSIVGGVARTHQTATSSSAMKRDTSDVAASQSQPAQPILPQHGGLVERLRLVAQIQTLLRQVAALQAGEPEHRAEREQGLRAISGIGVAYDSRLQALGVTTLHHLAYCQPSWISEKVGVSIKAAQQWTYDARQIVELTQGTSVESRRADGQYRARTHSLPYLWEISPSAEPSPRGRANAH